MPKTIISTEWTPEERLKVIAELMEQCRYLLESGSFYTLQHALTTTRFVSMQSDHFLEINRKTILDQTRSFE